MTQQGCPACRELTGGRCAEHSVVVTYYGQGMTPHCCPVCHGKGRVVSGFYGAIGVDTWAVSDLTPEQCRACAGSGVLWR